MTISHERNDDAGFKMRHTYVRHSVQSLSRLDTSLRIKRKQKKATKYVPQTLKKAICFNLPSASKANGIKCKMLHCTLQQFSTMCATYCP